MPATSPVLHVRFVPTTVYGCAAAQTGIPLFDADWLLLFSIAFTLFAAVNEGELTAPVLISIAGTPYIHVHSLSAFQHNCSHSLS